MNRKISTRRIVSLALTVMAAVGAAGAARADSVSLLNAAYTVGANSPAQINSFTVNSAGTLNVNLTDVAWPQPITSVMFELTSATGTVLGVDNSLGKDSFSLLAPGTYYAISYGAPAPASGSLAGFGTYGVSLSFAAAGATVPLPQPLLLLIAGLGFLALTVRRPGAAINL